LICYAIKSQPKEAERLPSSASLPAESGGQCHQKMAGLNEHQKCTVLVAMGTELAFIHQCLARWM